jgi:putative ABC transport system permease protein
VFAYGPRYNTDEKRLAFFEETLERFRAVPGVVRAGVSTVTPFLPSQIDIQGGYRVEGRPAPPDSELPVTTLTVATSDFFHALRIPLRRGRLFADTDRAGAPLVALVNEVIAERAWPGEDPVGQRITANWQGRWRTMQVVGVVGRVRHRRLEDTTRPELFIPAQQLPYGSMTFIVQTARDPAPLMPALKARIWEGNPTQAIYEATTLDSLVATSLAPRRFVMTVASALSGLAFALAALGIYGMLSFSTAQRTREIGVRMAMGGGTGDILRMVLGDGMRLVAAGIALGLLTALLLSRGIATLLFGVSTRDPLTLAATTGLLAAVALLACYVPARRAMRIDPLEALRAQ